MIDGFLFQVKPMEKMVRFSDDDDVAVAIEINEEVVEDDDEFDDINAD